MLGRRSLHSFFDDCSHFQKKKEHTHTGFTNNNENDNTFRIKNGPCETLPFFSFSSTFPFLFLSLPLPFLFLLLSFFLSFFLCFFLSFFVFFSVPFPFGFLSFSSPFPILSFPFLYYSFSFSLSSCEFFDQGVKPALRKTIRGKKKKRDNVWKNHLKRLGVFTKPQVVSAQSSRDVVALRSAVMRASRGMAVEDPTAIQYEHVL